MEIIEEKLKKCSKCKARTKHFRNYSKTSGFMLLVHIALGILTYGFWIAVVLIYKLLNSPIGGWMCSKCDK